MRSVRLSSKGQIVIPQPIRQARGWRPGQEFLLEEADGGVLLRPRLLFPPTTVDEVSGSLAYDGPALSIEAMDAAVQEAVRERWTTAPDEQRR